MLNMNKEKIKERLITAYMQGNADHGFATGFGDGFDQCMKLGLHIKFAKWSSGTMDSEGKNIKRSNPENYWEKLFDYWLENVYNTGYSLKIGTYAPVFQLSYEVDWQTGIRIAMETSKQFEAVDVRKPESPDGPQNHMDSYFDLFENSYIILKPTPWNIKM